MPELEWVNDLYVKYRFERRFRHLKTGKEYLVGVGTDNPIINCTNGNEEQTMVIYTDGQKIFVREWNEFHRKFTEIK